MNYARKLLVRLSLSEARPITLQKSLRGVEFDDDDSVIIPPGEYKIIGPDVRDKQRVVLVNTETEELYTVEKSKL